MARVAAPAFRASSRLALIVVLALPFFSMRLGLTDAGNDPPSSTTRQAYDLLAKGFGPGFNGPLQVVGEINSPADQRPLRRLRQPRLEPARRGRRRCRPAPAPTARPRWPSVSPPQPQDAQTTTLLHQLRGRRARSRSRQHPQHPHRRRDRHQEDFSHILAEQDAAVRRGGRHPGLPAAHGGLPQPPGPPGGVDHEPPLDRRRPGRHDRRLPVGLGQAAAGLRRRPVRSRCSCRS